MYSRIHIAIQRCYKMANRVLSLLYIFKKDRHCRQKSTNSCVFTFLSSMRVLLLILHCIYQALQIALLRRILSLHSSLRPLKFFHFGDTNLPLWTQNKYVFVRSIRSWHFGWWLINRDTNSCNEPFNCCSVRVTYSLRLIYIAHYRYPNIARSGMELD